MCVACSLLLPPLSRRCRAPHPPPPHPLTPPPLPQAGLLSSIAAGSAVGLRFALRGGAEALLDAAKHAGGGAASAAALAALAGVLETVDPLLDLAGDSEGDPLAAHAPAIVDALLAIAAAPAPAAFSAGPAVGAALRGLGAAFHAPALGEAQREAVLGVLADAVAGRLQAPWRDVAEPALCAMRAAMRTRKASAPAVVRSCVEPMLAAAAAAAQAGDPAAADEWLRDVHWLAAEPLVFAAAAPPLMGLAVAATAADALSAAPLLRSVSRLVRAAPAGGVDAVAAAHDG